MKYNCNICNEEWEFVPKDYNYNKAKYPTTCCQCQTPLLEVLPDIYKYEGIKSTFSYLYKRLKRKPLELSINDFKGEL